MSFDVFVNPKHFFSEALDKAFKERRIETYPVVGEYLSDLLVTYMCSDQLFMSSEDGQRQQKMLAEQLLEAQQAEKSKKLDMLRHLGDSTLYISGFFGDSLKRKIVDVDYYVEIGGTAYSALSKQLEVDMASHMYKEISLRFTEFVDVLSYISQESMIQSNEDLLRLYDRYLTTGSESAKEALAQKGLLNPDIQKKKVGQ